MTTATRFLRAMRPAGAVATLVAVSVLTATTGWAQNREHGFAAITVEPEMLDFGTMERNETRSADLLIRNDGGIDLEIMEVTSSCGCTVAKPDNKTLAPGASTRLAVTFNSKQFQGPQHKVITIRSNDPATPSLEISVTANVHVPIIAQPERLEFNFGRVRRGDNAVQTTWLTAQDVRELKISPGSLPKNLFKIETEHGIDGDPAKATISLRIRPDAPYGLFNEVLRVKTNVPAMPTIDFEVAGEVVYDLSVYPPAVNFRYVEQGKPLRYEVRVRPSKSGFKFKVTGARIDLPEFKVKIEERIPNRETVIVLTGQPVSPSDPRAVQAKGRMQGTLLISTDNPEQPELQVKVTYLLRT